MADDTTTVTPPAPVLMKDVIPQDLHDRPYLKDWLEKPADKEMWGTAMKKLDGAESLIGKKMLMPGPDAKPEEVDAFYAKLRVEKPEDYEFSLGENPDEEFIKEFRAAAHNADLSKRQMTKLVEGLTPGFTARQKVVADEQEARDAEFEKIVTETFKDDHKKVLERATVFMKANVPDNLKPHIDKLDNNALAILTGVVNSVIEKYVSEDDLKGGETSGAAGATDREALQKEARELQGSEAWKNFQHVDHEKTKKRVVEIYASPAFKTT